MDTINIIEGPILVNFRAPRETIDLLDQVSRFNNRTRTSVILDVINGWLAKKTQEIPQRIQANNNLKSALNSYEKSRRELQRAVSINRSEITCDSNRFIPPMILRSTVDFDDEQNGRL